jgi:hypothetical protein
MARGQFSFTEESIGSVVVFCLSRKIIAGRKTNEMFVRLNELVENNTKYFVL